MRLFFKVLAHTAVCICLSIHHIGSMTPYDAKLPVTKQTQENALYLAVLEGDHTICAKLLQQGAPVNNQLKELMSPLYVAASQGNADMCSLLLRYKADASFADSASNTPLHAAVLNGHRDVVTLLIGHNAGLKKLPNSKGQIPLHYAARSGQHEICILLADEETVLVGDFQGDTPLHWGVFEGHKEVVLALVCYPKALDATNSSGQTPLHIAALQANPEVYQLLRAAGALCCVDTTLGRSALHWAAYAAQEEMVIYLLKHEQQILNILNLQDRYGATALHYAAYRGLERLCTELLKRGAYPAFKNEERKTPAECAYKYNHGNVGRICERHERLVRVQVLNGLIHNELNRCL